MRFKTGREERAGELREARARTWLIREIDRHRHFNAFLVCVKNSSIMTIP